MIGISSWAPIKIPPVLLLKLKLGQFEWSWPSLVQGGPELGAFESQLQWHSNFLHQGAIDMSAFLRWNMWWDSFQTWWVALIWPSMPFSGGSKGSGLTRKTKGVLDSIAYCVAVRTRPRWPYMPPTNTEGTELALAFNSSARTHREPKFGCPAMWLRALCCKQMSQKTGSWHSPFWLIGD